MDINQTDTIQNKRKRRKRILWILLPVFLGSTIVLLNLPTKPLYAAVGFFMLIFGIADMVILNLSAEKYYNWPVVFIVIFITGLVFKRNHWPMAGYFMASSLFFLSLTSLVNSVRFLFKIKQNPFLKWFGSISSFIISIYAFAWLNMVLHWSRTLGNTLGYAGVFLFIIAVLGMVFTLPGSNYISWTDKDRKIFFRAVLLPMVIVFTLIIISNVFPDLYFWILDIGGTPWDVNKGIELQNLEGIPKY
ncbi:MAG: hypothetical protein MUF36_12755 [Bacteroidales bacterium]|nr:hypothetical protein [Bacteroidales bacterium]